VVGAIGARVFIGAICDTVGPRYAVAGVLLLIAPPVYCTALVVDQGGLIAVRFFIGVGLCIFVCNQFWAGTMFSPNCVGTVNATCGGWGNLGGEWWGEGASVPVLLAERAALRVPCSPAHIASFA